MVMFDEVASIDTALIERIERIRREAFDEAGVHWARWSAEPTDDVE